MKGMKKVILAAIVLPLTLGSISVFAAGGQGKQGMNRGNQFGECGITSQRAMMQVLDLTADQVEKIQTIHQDERKRMRAGFESRQKLMRNYRQEMRKIELAKNFDEKAAQALAQKMTDDRGVQRQQDRLKRQVERMRIHHEIMNVLTPEQQKKWEVVMEMKPFDHCKSHRGQKGGKGHFGWDARPGWNDK